MKTLAIVLSLLPALALAQPACPHQRPHELALDLDGVEVLAVELGRHTLRLNGADNADGVVRGRACASSERRLAGLSLSQERQGTRLMLRAEDTGGSNVFRLFGGSDYAYHELSLKVPGRLAIELELGSGDAFIHDVATLDAQVGSGDLEAGRIAGRLALRIGSGDARIESAGELAIGSIGSGDLVARDVRGDLEIGSVGSGDVSVRGIGGEARIGSVGSGDIALSEVARGVRAGSIGSGDIALKSVGGNVEVERIGSGDLRVTDVEGDVHIRRKGSGDVHPHNVKGEVSIVLEPRD